MNFIFYEFISMEMFACGNFFSSALEYRSRERGKEMLSGIYLGPTGFCC
jgi:hypothetical protein